ncbi:MAG: DUF4062 domain-containing protein [Armatimonadetes bacterium]|nr:DUF4062 domain-containing protein [Armatimonadota bacterium]
MDSALSIYVSSTYRDLTEYRQAVAAVIRRLGHRAVAMEDYGATDLRPLAKCLQDVAGCDLFVGLLGLRYGYVPDDAEAQGRSITEMEYREACARGVPVLMFLLGESAAPEGCEEPQRSLRDELCRDRVVDFFSSPEEAAVKVSTAIAGHMHARMTDELERIYREAQEATAEQERQQQAEMERLRKEQEEVDRRRRAEQTELVAGPIPSGIVQHFRDRVNQLGQLYEALSDERLHLVIVCGRGGMGKTALITKLVREIYDVIAEATYPPAADRIVYLTLRQAEYRSPDKIVDLICRTLPLEEAEQLRQKWQSNLSLTEKLEFLFHRALTNQRYLIVLDNFEDVLDEDNTVLDEFAELRTFIERAVEFDHRAIIMATSRRSVMLSSELEGRAGERKDEVSLDVGLPEDEAVALLRELDRDGRAGTADATDEVLRRLARQCHGIPRTIEVLVGWLKQHPTWDLERLLDDEQALNDIVSNPARELYASLTAPEQLILQVLAVYGRPVPLAAIRQMLPGLPVDGLLDGLVRNYVVTYDRRKFSLHPLDQHYAYERIPAASEYSRESLHRAAAEFWQQVRKPTSEWQDIDDLEPQLEEFHHLASAGLYDQAAEILGDIDFDYLWQWGYGSQMLKLRQELAGRLTDPHLMITNLGSMGRAYWTVGALRDSVACFREGMALARDESEWGNMLIYANNAAELHLWLGEFDEAARLIEATLPLAERVHHLYSQELLCSAAAMLNLLRHDHETAVAFADRAVAIPEASSRPYNVAYDLSVAARCHLHLGQSAEASACCERALRHEAQVPQNRTWCYVGIARLQQGQGEAAEDAFSRGVEAGRALLDRTPSAWEAMYYLAFCLLGLGRTAEATDLLAEAIRACDGRGVLMDALDHVALMASLPEPPPALDEAATLLQAALDMPDRE